MTLTRTLKVALRALRRNVMRAVLTTLIDDAGVPIEVRVDPARVKPIDIDRHYGSVARLRAILGDSPADTVVPTLKRLLRELVREP